MTLAELAWVLTAERKRQKLSREDAAAVCGVSMSFIRDAESNPENCSLGKLARYINGLGLSLEVAGFDVARSGLPKSERGAGLGLTSPASTGPLGLSAAAMRGLRQVDFGVSDSQLVGRAEGALSDLTPQEPSQPSIGLGLASRVAQHGIKGKSKGKPS